MRIIVDLLGSDLGPIELVKGVYEAAKKSKANYTLIGSEKDLKEELGKLGADLSRFEFIDCYEYIKNEDQPVRAIRRKKDSSTVIGLNKLNEEGYDGFISAGSTGALLAGGLFITKRIDNIERAIITAELPTEKGKAILADTGAVMDSTPEMQVQYAKMGALYVKHVLGKDKPRVALLNVGAEEGKGDMRAKKTYDLLKEEEKINFVGNIEARYALSGQADVIVADGFVGNVLLKSIEGVAGLLMREIKTGIMSSIRGKLGGLLAKPAFKGIAKKYNYKEVGAALLLGIKKPVFKAHGSSDAQAMKSAILIAEKIIKSNVVHYIEEEFKND